MRAMPVLISEPGSANWYTGRTASDATSTSLLSIAVERAFSEPLVGFCGSFRISLNPPRQIARIFRHSQRQASQPALAKIARRKRKMTSHSLIKGRRNDARTPPEETPFVFRSGGSRP